MNPPHLSDETILLLHSGELDSPDQSVAEGHLESCSRCRIHYSELIDDLAAVEALALESSTLRFGGLLADRQVRRFPRLGRIPVAIGSLAAGAGVAVSLFFWSSGSVDAAQLIGRAVAEQEVSAKSPRIRAVSVHAGRLDCSGEFSPLRLAAVSRTSACSRVRSVLMAAHWDLSSPLSASSFNRWRNSLTSKNDTVFDTGGNLVLRTSTSGGLMRAASLAVQSATFHPVAVSLELEGGDPVEIRESSAPEEPAVSTVVSRGTLDRDPTETSAASSQPATAEPRTPASDALVNLDAAEVDVWVRLHSLKADSGFETVLSRTADAVEVFGLVANDRRSEEIRHALEPIRGVRLKLKTYSTFEPGDDRLFPVGEIGNSLPPLAKEWLKQAFPKAAGQQAFVEAVQAKARAILGIVATSGRLRERIAVLPNTPELLGVEREISEQRQTLLRELAELLRPYLGEACGPPDNLEPNLSGAKHIDSALVRLMVASRNPSDDIHIETDLLRTALGCPAK